MSDDEITPFSGDSGDELDHYATKVSALDELADQQIAEGQPENTKRAHIAGWKVWTEYCETLDIPNTSNSRGPLVGFVIQQARLGFAYATVDSRISAVMVGLAARDVPATDKTKGVVRESLRILKRTLAEQNDKRGRGQSAPLLIPRLRRIVEACPETNAGIRDRALVTMAFGIAARRSEIANLLITDIDVEPRGLMATIRFSKTGARKVQIVAQPGSPTCPAAAWASWARLLNESEGPAFRRIHRSGRILGGMSAKAAGEIITRAAKRADIEVHITGHSARSGLVTEATNAGHTPDIIALTTGHLPNSKVLWDYRRVEDGWTKNATVGIGL